MNSKLYHGDVANFREGDFRINSDLEVFFGNELIGGIRIVENDHPEGDDKIACFLPGFVGFQHYPVYDTSSACQTIYEKFYAKRRK